jgi:hypothetical protein
MGAMDDQFACAAELWTALDEPWREAFRQAWAALRSGTIAVGACASTADGQLSPREAGRTQAIRIGPCHDELGVFGTLIARFGPRRSPRLEGRLRAVGEGPILDLVDELESTGEKDRLVDMQVNEALDYLWPRLRP